MAIGFVLPKVFSRSQGHTLGAALAYRCGLKLWNPKANKTEDYSGKTGVLSWWIQTPANIHNSAPWCNDIQEIVNRTEATEDMSKRRADAQLMREMVFALPHEFSQEQREQVIRETVQKAVDLGMVAIVAIHAPSEEGDERNFHAHVCFTMRDLDPTSKTGFGKKNRAWNDIGKGKKAKSGGLYKEVIGKAWEQSVNFMMDRLGLNERIDMRSYKERGLELEPQKHISHKAYEMERRGIETEQGQELREIAERNQERRKIFMEMELLEQEMAHLKQSLDREVTAKEKKQQEWNALMQQHEESIRRSQEEQGERGIDNISKSLTETFNQAAEPEEMERELTPKEKKQQQWNKMMRQHEQNKRHIEQERQEKTLEPKPRSWDLER